MNDDANTGFTSVPTRYATASGREVIDLIRDSLSDEEFVAYCLGNAMKYRARAGKKGDAHLDFEKADFYGAMADHIRDPALTPDPRSARPDFTPYKRAGVPVKSDWAMFAERPVLDHGFVRLVERWGGGDSRLPEAGIIEAARQSTQGSFRGWERDARLLRYLHEHKHATPFEFAGMVIEVRAPIFVFREWHRHRTQSYNEMSARYAPLPSLYYTPSWEEVLRRGRAGALANKQAGAAADADQLTEAEARRFVDTLQGQYAEFDAEYQAALSRGIPKELARLGMPVGHYSQMRASANLRNWLAFLTLRLDPAAQWEIRQYAEAVAQIIYEAFPQTARLFAESFREGT